MAGTSHAISVVTTSPPTVGSKKQRNKTKSQRKKKYKPGVQSSPVGGQTIS